MNITFPCYLTHPENGTHIAYDMDEVERLTKWYGWTVQNRVNGSDAEPAVQHVHPSVIAKRGPGRPRKVN